MTSSSKSLVKGVSFDTGENCDTRSLDISESSSNDEQLKHLFEACDSKGKYDLIIL